MCRRREYEADVRAVIAEEKANTAVTLRWPELSGSTALPQPKETLEPGTVVQVTVESPR